MDDLIDLTKLMSLTLGKIPEGIHPVFEGKTRASSLAAITGCDVRSGAIFSTTSMAAFLGVDKYYLETILMTEPEAGFVYRYPSSRVFATYPGSLCAFWDERAWRVYQGQLKRAGKAAEHLITDCTPGSNIKS